MRKFEPDSRAVADDHNFALLHFDGTRLLVPQGDVRLLDLVADVDQRSTPANGVGWITFRQERAPVYSLSAQLEWQSGMEANRTICALLEAEGYYFGVMCTEVGIVQAGQIALHEIPVAMRRAEAPFSDLAFWDNNLACVSSAIRLKACLPVVSGEDGQTLPEAL